MALALSGRISNFVGCQHVFETREQGLPIVKVVCLARGHTLHLAAPLEVIAHLFAPQANGKELRIITKFVLSRIVISAHAGGSTRSSWQIAGGQDIKAGVPKAFRGAFREVKIGLETKSPWTGEVRGTLK
jgi:hypothetical protein